MEISPYHPVAVLAMLLIFILIFTKRIDFQGFIATVNSVGSQPTAITVLFVGCIMLVECKKNGIDPTIAGGIIGVASNMLTNMFVKSHTEQPSGKSTQDIGTVPATPQTVSDPKS